MILQILVRFLLSELVQIWGLYEFSITRMEGMAWKGRTEAYFQLFVLSSLPPVLAKSAGTVL